MPLHGKQLIAGEPTASGTITFVGNNPSTSETLEPPYHEATLEEVDRAMNWASDSFDELRAIPPDRTAAFLDAVADAILGLGDELLERAHAETGLPMARLTGERGRTVGQTRMFAELIREGSWLQAKIDTADPGREPLPKPDVRSLLRPIGPVVVFGASNFPFAIGVVGTDTLCALAAGCPVVVKAHPAHPGTCELLAGAVHIAIEQCGFPAGIFSMVHGATHETGLALVRHPAACAVAFTGSLTGGRALADAAATRSEPIPVYAEMGSTNPVFLLPGALKKESASIAAGYVQSVTMGTGQFCTNPGILFGLGGKDFEAFCAETAKQAEQVAPATMLHAGIRKSFRAGVDILSHTGGLELLARSAGQAEDESTQAPCMLFRTDIGNLRKHPALFDEVFGPSSVIVQAESRADLEEVAAGLDGHLTATVHGTEKDLKDYAGLIGLLEKKVGRIVFNGFPTGIEVCAAMHHGGPYPATTHGFFTSIGPASILRFVRPVCYQNFPDAALPPELQNGNPRGIWRLVDNRMSRDPAAS